MSSEAARMPAVFVGHGSPMNALEDNDYSRAWRRMARSWPRPKAILAISAHWYVETLAVTAMAAPSTIHDFAGFPKALFDFDYPAPGSPELAARVRELLSPAAVTADLSWGLDHGTWSVLAHLYPEADIPVVQLSIARGQPRRFHYDIGSRLEPLRDEGVLILASGNVVHHLGLLDWQHPASGYDWASRIEQLVKERLAQRNHPALIAYPELDPQARLAVPTPEHYLPLLYLIGLQQDDDTVSFPVGGITMGSLSMLSVAVAAPAHPVHSLPEDS